MLSFVPVTTVTLVTLARAAIAGSTCPPNPEESEGFRNYYLKVRPSCDFVYPTGLFKLTSATNSASDM